MKVYYVANFYMPFEKAYGIQLAKMCEAFVEEGVDLTLVLPRRGPCTSLREFYKLRVDIPTVWLPALDFSEYDRAGYAMMSLSFSISYLLFFLRKRLLGEQFVLYTIDADRYSSSALALVPAPIFSEMHGGKPRTISSRLLFSRLRGVIAINSIIIRELKETFPRSGAAYIAEPNGVDLAAFAPQDKMRARSALGLPADVPIVLYAGRFYEWKGLEIIPAAARCSPELRWQIVGGTQDQFRTVVNGELPSNVHCAGGKSHRDMPVWIAAADAVLVLGTKRDEQSYRWTSPMKLFEYLAAGRPIIASATPAVREIVSEKEAFLYEPDAAEDLARCAREVVKGGPESDTRIASALSLAQSHSWNERARRAKRFMQTVLLKDQIEV